MSTVIPMMLVAAVVVAAAWWWFVGRNVPAFPPLELGEDDPLIAEATREARESIPQLRELFAADGAGARVKIPFVTNSGETEHLWAELLSLGDDEMTVRYITPPVSHTGKLERVHTHRLSDLEDWVVTTDPEHFVGGYSMRVMFRRAREQWGQLPPQLVAEEAKYR